MPWFAHALLWLPSVAATPSYHQDIAPLLARHCLGCHRAGGLGRVELDTYERASRYVREIRQHVGTRFMPPWKAIPGYGHFRNERSLTTSEIERILAWTDGGTPEGSPTEQVPFALAHEDLGDPDLSFKVEYTVPANGYPEVRCFAFPVQLVRDYAVRAIDVRPGDPRVVAYVRALADPTGDSLQSDAADPRSGYDCFAGSRATVEATSLGEWSAGLPPQPLPSGFGRLLPPKAAVILEIRYHRLGQEITDRSEVLLYCENNPKFIVRTHAVANRGFVLPPDSWDFRVDAKWVVPRNLRVLSVIPHMNRLGTEMRVSATQPGEHSRNLVWVREWNRHLQMAYVFAEPLRLAAGSTIDVTARFNNSADNEQQGHSPPREVRWGWGDKDERTIAFIEYVEDP
jgi:hypothetical protein